MSTADATTAKTSEKSVPRILLYCGSAPGQSGVGGIVLRDFCDALPTGKIQCFAVPTRGHSGEMQDCPEVADFVVRRYDTAYRPVPGILGELVALAARQAKRPRYLRTVVERAVEFVETYLPLAGRKQAEFQQIVARDRQYVAVGEMITTYEKKGKKEGKKEDLILLLEKKFGKLSAALRRKVRRIEFPQELESLLLAVLDADSLEDLPI